MSDEISFHEPRRGFIPIVEGADGNLLFKQRSRSGGRKSMPLAFAVWLENSISSRWTHREKLVPTVLVQMEMLMALQRLHSRGQKWNETLGTDVIGGCPRQVQCLLHLWSVIG